MGLMDGDPVSAATRSGRVPTLGNVKRSVRVSASAMLSKDRWYANYFLVAIGQAIDHHLPTTGATSR